jgi:hypothetical protein
MDSNHQYNKCFCYSILHLDFHKIQPDKIKNFHNDLVVENTYFEIDSSLSSSLNL